MRRLRLSVVAGSLVVVALMSASTGWAQSPEDGAEVESPGAVADSLEQAVDREVRRLLSSPAVVHSPFQAVQQPGRQKRSWIARHPALFGALVGFGGGFLIGYLAGDDGIFDDFDAQFNGAVLGGVGALAGAIVGELASTP